MKRYSERCERRFSYRPGAISLSTRQAIELLDQALASGASSPSEVKRHLLVRREHRTSFGSVRFDPSGESPGHFTSLPQRPSGNRERAHARYRAESGLMWRRSLRLQPKAAAAPISGSGPGTGAVAGGGEATEATT